LGEKDPRLTGPFIRCYQTSVVAVAVFPLPAANLPSNQAVVHDKKEASNGPSQKISVMKIFLIDAFLRLTVPHKYAS